jgi:hypothetical protein
MAGMQTGGPVLVGGWAASLRLTVPGCRFSLKGTGFSSYIRFGKMNLGFSPRDPSKRQPSIPKPSSMRVERSLSTYSFRGSGAPYRSLAARSEFSLAFTLTKCFNSSAETLPHTLRLHRVRCNSERRKVAAKISTKVDRFAQKLTPKPY